MEQESFDKEKFEANLKVAQLGFDLWDRRRSCEWRMTFSLWALLVGAVVTTKFELPRCFLIWCATVILVFYTFAWLWPLWKSNARDKNLGRAHLAVAQALLQSPNEPFPQTDIVLYRFFVDWACLFQIVATALLLGAVCWLKGY